MDKRKGNADGAGEGRDPPRHHVPDAAGAGGADRGVGPCRKSPSQRDLGLTKRASPSIIEGSNTKYAAGRPSAQLVAHLLASGWRASS